MPGKTRRVRHTFAGVGTRSLAGLLGGYLVAYSGTLCLAVYLPLARPDRAVWASLASFALWALAMLLAFACRTPLRAWLWLAGLSLLLSGSAWLAGTWGMRP